MKKKSQNPEPIFVKDFTQVAEYQGYRVFIIPDPMGITEDNRFYNREKKRPFDFVLITPNRVYCIEAKYQYGKQLDHQAETERKMRQVNPGAYYLIRKKMNTQKTKVTYTVEQAGIIIFTCSDLLDLVNLFK